MYNVAKKEKVVKLNMLKGTQNVRKKFGSVIKKKKSKMYMTYVLYLFAF